MKILFITDFAALREESKSCILLYSMVRKCILQILIYLKQAHPNLNNPINVGFKCCDTRSDFEIPRDIANSPKQFHPFTSTKTILQQFSREYKSTHASRKKRDKKQMGSSSYMNTSTSSMTLQLRDQPGLSQIIIALSQCIKQYPWCSTLETNNTNDDSIESQMIFILSSMHNIDGDMKMEWKRSIKCVSQKEISINYIHVHPLWDKTPIHAAIDNMHLCLQKLSYLSIGVIPLTLLWMAPILNLQHQFIKIFKSNKNILFPAHKLYQENIKWNGNIYIKTIKSLNSLRRSKRLINTNNKLLINCDLLSIECNKRFNKQQQENENNNVYDDILNNIRHINIDGILDENCLQKMDHLPYISLIIRPTTKNTKLETQEFQHLFASTLCANPKQHFVVTFNDDCNDNIKGVMYCVLPSFVILKIYVLYTWNTKSKLTNVSAKMSTNINLNNCIKSMLNLQINNDNNNKFKAKCIVNHKKKTKINKKMKSMKEKLAILYKEQLNNEEKQKEEKNIDKNPNNNINNNDRNQLEIRINDENKNKNIQEKFSEICTLFVNIYDLLLCKQSLKGQHVRSFMDITFKSFYNLCKSEQLFNDIALARKHIKYFLKKEIFIVPSSYAKIRGKKHLNVSQQIFDIKIQILLLLQYGCMHFTDEILRDPIARFKYFDAYLQKLYIKDVKTYNEFIEYITNKYASKLPKTFEKYYQNKEEEIPSIIASYLNSTNLNISSLSTSLSQSPHIQPVQPQTNNKPNRKRRYSDISGMSDVQNNNKRFKGFKQTKDDNHLKNVIITPMLANKTKNTNQKIVSSSSRRTLTRSQRGGALRSGKRPLRLVLGDKTNSSHHAANGKSKKKRKLTRSSTTFTQSVSPEHTNVFSVNSNHSNPITNSAMKLRSSEWVKQNKLHKKRKNRKRKRRKSQNKKTPPLLRRCQTESNVSNISDELQANKPALPTFSFGLSKTQSMSDLSRPSENRHAPPERKSFSEEASPLSQPLTRSCSAMDVMLHKVDKQRVHLDAYGNDERMAVDDNINNAMHPDWCELDENELPPDCMAKEVYIHPSICGNSNNNFYVAASQTNSVVPPTPTPLKKMSNQRFCFGGGYGHKDEDDIFMLDNGDGDGDNNTDNGNVKFVPETPDDNGDNGGNGASNIKSHCAVNMRSEFHCEDQAMEDFLTKKRLNRQISFAGL